MATAIESRARMAAQERAQTQAAKVARQLAEAAADKEPNGDKATAAYTRVFNHAMPILFDQSYPEFYRQEYSRLLVEGSSVR
jgi:hypothetical protein